MHNVNKNVRCALCREVSKDGETYLVHTGRAAAQNNDNNVACTSEAKVVNGSVQIKNAANAVKEEKMEVDDVEEFGDIQIKVCKF
jgi:hypothetical protein